jgi:YihY family inner membrane protein
MKVRAVLGSVDAIQRGHAALGLPYAVIKRFGESGAGSLAATIAYYGFFSLFPLLMVLVSVAGVVLHDRPELQERLVGSALAQFPVIGAQIKGSIGSIDGSFVAVSVGLAIALWAGIGGIRAAQVALDTIWDVPRRDRRGPVASIGLALVMLCVVGAFVLTGAILAALATVYGSLGSAIAWIGALATNVLLFAVAFRILVADDLRWSSILPGACLAGVLWTILLSVGDRIVSDRVSSASDVYGVFAIVIGLLAWIYLGAQVTALGAVANVVISERLWPRSIAGASTDADGRALVRSAMQEQRTAQERIDVRFDGAADER